MKSTKISIYALLLAVLGLWSCNNDDMEQSGVPQQDNAGEPVAMTFSASMGGSLSKSTVSATTGETKFSSDDHIKIFTLDGSDAEFTCASVSDNGTKAQFAGSSKKSNGYYAVLPYQEKAKANGNVLTLSINPEQTSKYEDLMVGYTTNDDCAFQFKHVGAMIRFITYRKFASFEIEDTKGNKIAGDVSVKISNDGKKTEVSGGTSTKVSVTRDISNADSVLITLKPGTYEAGELKIKFCDKDGSWFFHEIDKKITLKSGVIYSYGNVGRHKITCKDSNTGNTLFSMYASDYEIPGNDNQIPGKALLPLLTAKEGYLYGYAEKANGTVMYTNSISGITKNTTIYAVETEGVKVTIYGNGAKSQPTEQRLVFPNSNMTLPDITMKPSAGKVCGYAYNANATPTMAPGDVISIKKAAINIYAVETSPYIVNIYGNGASQAITDTYSGLSGFSFTLPTLPAKSGQFAGYTTEKGSADFNYYQGQKLTYDTYIFYDNPLNFYPVYCDLLSVTKTNNVSLSGKKVGDGFTCGENYMDQPYQKVDKGTCSVFKFVNHCNTSLSADNNVCIVLLDKNDPTTTNLKTLRLNQNQFGEAENNVPGDLMTNINGATVTVSVSNKGGVADVEISWTGSTDTRPYSVKYKNICIWSDLYVTFGVNNSYIELQ